MRASLSVRSIAAVAAALLCALAVALLGSAPATARGEEPECDLIASPDGSDTGAGTAEDPLRSPQALVDALDFGAPGDPATGCLEPGDYDSDPQTSISESYLRLTSLGRPARLNGSVRVEDGAEHVALDRLILDGAANPDAGTVSVLGDDFSLTDSQVTERHVASAANSATCVRIGTVQSPAARASIVGNRIYDCGLRGTTADSGVAIYHSRGSLVLGNSISSSASRAVSLFPSAVHTRVLNNDLFDNGSAVLFDSAASDGDPATSVLDPSAENVVASNLIRRNGVNSDGQGTTLLEYQVYGRADTGPGNALINNCLYSPTGDGNADVTGFLSARNTANEPRARICRDAYGPGGSTVARPYCLDLTEGAEIADTLSTGGRSDLLAGNGGPDTLASGGGADCVYGGADLDTLDGGAGRDFLSGGAEADVIRAGDGPDTIESRGDGVGDRVNCGAGRDLVLADASDIVAKNCEQVR